MVIVVKIKNVVLRGKTYHFRMAVPIDCRQKIGRHEITLSLRTEDPIVAKGKADWLTQKWTAEFKATRDGESHSTKKTPALQLPPSHARKQVERFHQILMKRMEKNLPPVIDQSSIDDLRNISQSCRGAMEIIARESHSPIGVPELDLEGPWQTNPTPGIDRRLRQAAINVLQKMRLIIDGELGFAYSVEYDKSCLSDHPQELPGSVGLQPQEDPAEKDITAVAELMITSKKRVQETVDKIRAEVRCLREWTGDKSDISAYTKRDLVEYVQNCLPFIPSNMNRIKQYEGKSLKECIALTKEDPEKHRPISHTTCENRLRCLQMVFRFAIDQLGIISVNPAAHLDIPDIQQSEALPRGFTTDELSAMWEKLREIKAGNASRPALYWVPILCLYHGMRLNEACSLFVRDVYEDTDRVFVIDLNENGPHKSLKNKSSVRTIPIHPYVLDGLEFRQYVESQATRPGNELLFPELTYRKSHGYRSKVSRWFAKWKKEWLPEESMYKHFHDLRYTFIQQAQNVAGIPDRHAQEITGHSIEGVSAVHLGYSGRLKPKALLEELQKISYGWE